MKMPALGPSFAVLVAISLVLACGSVSRSPSGDGTPTPPAREAGAVTEQDDGVSLRLEVGQTLRVTLHQLPGYTEWGSPQSSDPRILAPIVAAPSAGTAVFAATFRAAAPGTARLSSATGLACSPGRACPALARAWTVTVAVS